MTDKNSVEFTVRLKDEGLDKLAGSLENVEQKVDALGGGAATAGQGLKTLDSSAGQAGDELNTLATAGGKAGQEALSLGSDSKSAGQGVDAMGNAASDAGSDLGRLSAAIAQKTQAIRSGLALEQSEIELQRQHLVLARDQQQAILQAARARGDEATATQAENRLRQIEVDQLGQVARAKRAEAAAVQSAVDARREELAAVGPLTAAQQRELQTSENLAKSLRVQAAAADGAAQRINTLGNSTQQAAQKSEAFPGVLTKVAGAVAGAFAVDRVIEFGKSVGEVADNYKNLEARLRLAIGAQGDLQAAVQGVGTVAKDTFSNLDATAALYGRLASSGKELNISNAEALGLTKTINQSIQVSGASAQASEASVRQLIQGLQSGVIRGDEFNSIMEQAPRLAKAMADGLGVPIGALRGLAEQGQLTSAKVVAALKGQSDAINKEFASTPLTTGRALENLNTQWTLFIGNLSGGAQQSSVVAQGINAVAGNLETLAAVAARAGSVLTAALAVQGVQALRAFALEMATTGKAASLMALELSNVPKVISITVAAVGFEVGFQIGEMLYNNSEYARKLGVGITAFMQNMVNDLVFLKDAAAAIFTSDTIDAAFDRYRQRGREMDAIFSDMWDSAKKAPTSIGAAADAAAAKTGAMGTAAQAAGAQVAQAGAAGAAGVGQVGKAANDAAGAFKALLDAAAQPVVKGNAVAQMAQDLTEARKRGVDLDGLLRTTLPEAIGKLSGAELAKFRLDFIATLQAAGSESKALQTGLRIIGEQAAKSLGVDVVTASSHMGEEFVQANEKMRMLILSMPVLKAAGVDTGQVVGLALSKMIDGAKNQAEIDAVVLRLQALRKELGNKVTDGLLDQAKQKAQELKAALEDSIPGIQSVGEAMRRLGITSDESLKKTAASSKEAYDYLVQKGTSSSRELTESFKKYATEAIAANNGVATSGLDIEAAMRGLKITTDSTGKAIVSAMDEGKQAAAGLADQVRETTTALQQQNAALEKQIAAQEKSNELAKRAVELENQRRGVDKDGFATDKGGQRLVAGSDLTTRTGIRAFLKAAGVDDDAAATRITNEFANSKGEIDYFNNAGQKKYGGEGSTISEALLKAAEKYAFSDKNKGTTTIPAQTQTINISINGQNTPVTVATANDANALRSVIDQLAAAAGRSS